MDRILMAHEKGVELEQAHQRVAQDRWQKSERTIYRLTTRGMAVNWICERVQSMVGYGKLSRKNKILF
jgi:hypothetical protein